MPINQKSQAKFALGFIGSGRIARRHAAALAEIAAVEIHAWSAGNFSNAEASAAEYGGTAMQTDSLLADPNIHAVLICSPTHLHQEHIHKALRSGKKIFCEKPITRHLHEIDDIIEAGRQHLYIGHVLRFFHAYNRARQIIQRGDLGKIQHVVCKRLGRKKTDSTTWMLKPELSGGVLLDLAIHDFDWLLWTFGEANELGLKIDPEKDPHGWLHAITQLSWQDGLKATVESSWLNDVFETGLFVEGEQGTLSVDPGHPDEIVLKSIQYERAIPLTGLPDPYKMQMRHFVGWLNGLLDPIVTLDEARAALALSLRAIDAKPGT